MLGHMVILFLVLEKPLYCFPQWLHPFTSPSRGSGCRRLHTLASTYFLVFDDNILVGVKWLEAEVYSERIVYILIPLSP